MLPDKTVKCLLPLLVEIQASKNIQELANKLLMRRKI